MAKLSKFSPTDLKPHLSAAEAKLLICNWTDKTAAQRSKMISACNIVAKICGLPIESVMMDCAWLNERFYLRPAVTFGMTRRRFADVASSLRDALEGLGLHAKRHSGENGLSPAWLQLWHLAKPKLRIGVSGFMHFASAHGIEPEAVTPASMMAFEVWVTCQTLHRDIHAYLRVTGYAWKAVRIAVREWPAVELKAPTRRSTYGVAVSELPQSFQDDLARFTDRLAVGYSGKLFAEVDPDEVAVNGRRRRRKPARLATVASRREQIHFAASALIQSGFLKERLLSLRDLVEPLENAEKIVTFFWVKNGEKPGGHVSNITEALRQIALFHCTPASLSGPSLSAWMQAVSPPQNQGMTEKNRKRLRAMVTQPAYGDILHLPGTLMAEAYEESRPYRAAILAMRAMMIEILLVCPMRRETLRQIRIDTHLQRFGEKAQLVTHLWIGGELSKTNTPLEWPLPPESAVMLEEWIRRYRPIICQPGNPYLFGGEGDLPMSKGGMYSTIIASFKQRLGITVNPHLLRHFAAWMYLSLNPGCYDLVSMVLGHSSVETTKTFYTGLEIDAVARHFDDTVMRERAATKPAAMTHLSRRRNRRMPPTGGIIA